MRGFPVNTAVWKRSIFGNNNTSNHSFKSFFCPKKYTNCWLIIIGHQGKNNSVRLCSKEDNCYENLATRRRNFCSLRVQNDKLPLWNTHRLVLISIHCTGVVAHDYWLTVPENATLMQEQLTENLLPVPLPWQFSSTRPFRRLAAGPVWVMSKISKMFLCFVLLCLYFSFSIFLSGWKSLPKECRQQKASSCRQ